MLQFLREHKQENSYENRTRMCLFQLAADALSRFVMDELDLDLMALQVPVEGPATKSRCIA